MSQVPAISQTIEDGGLGIPASTPQLLHVKMGIASAGVRNKAFLQVDTSSLVTALQAGPLVTGAGFHIQRAGQLWTVRTHTSTRGSIGSVMKVPAGVDTGTMTVGLSTFTIHATAPGGAALNLISGFTPLQIPGFITISLASPGTATDYHVTGYGLDGSTILTETIHVANGPSSTLSVNEYTSIISITTTVDPAGVSSFTTVSTTPVDSYDMIVQIMTSGSVAAQTMQFSYSMDAGKSFSPTIVVPASGVIDLQTYAPGGSNNPYLGFKLTFTDGAGPANFLRGDQFIFQTTAPVWTLADLLTAMDAVANDPAVRQNYTLLHAVGRADGTIFVGVEAQVQSYADQKFQYRRIYIEAVRQGNTAEATWAAAVVSSFNVTGTRTGVVAMDMDIIDPTTSTIPRRNFGSVYMARLMSCPISELPSHVACEAVYGIKTTLEGVVNLYQGDASDATLTLANIVAARSFPTRTGFYITRGILKTT